MITGPFATMRALKFCRPSWSWRRLLDENTTVSKFVSPGARSRYGVTQDAKSNAGFTVSIFWVQYCIRYSYGKISCTHAIVFTVNIGRALAKLGYWNESPEIRYHLVIMGLGLGAICLISMVVPSDRDLA